MRNTGVDLEPEFGLGREGLVGQRPGRIDRDDRTLVHAQGGSAGGTGLGESEDIAAVGAGVSDAQGAKLAFATDNGKVWLVLRPRAGAPATTPATVSVDTLLGTPRLTTGGK